MKLYRLVTPSDANILCRAQAVAAVTTCPLTELHTRSGGYLTNAVVDYMPKGRSAPRSFCYSWSWRYLAATHVFEGLVARGISGFSRCDAEFPLGCENASGFDEFRLSWNGELSSDPRLARVSSYCEKCGLIDFEISRDPPWSEAEICSSSDFFYLGPAFFAFCSEKAYFAMKELCGDDFLAVPAGGATGLPGTALVTSMSWPPVEVQVTELDLNLVWDRLLSLDPDRVLPRTAPE